MKQHKHFVTFLCTQEHGGAEREDAVIWEKPLSQIECPRSGMQYITVYGQAELTWIPLELQMHGRKTSLVSFCKTRSPLY